MSTTAPKPVTTPMPGQLSAPECTAFLWPHLSMPRRGPQCHLGYERVFTLILWGRSTGMHWQCWPLPPETQGTPALHDTTVYKGLATWADDGSLWQACGASVRHLAVAQPLALSVLQGDGTNTVATKAAMAWASRDTNPRRARRSLPSSPPRARGERPSPGRPSMRPTWCGGRKACTP